MSAFKNLIDTVPKEFKKYLEDGIMVIPIKVFFPDYEKVKSSISEECTSSDYSSENTMHKYTSKVPISEEKINEINQVLWPFVREYYELWQLKCPAYFGGFSISYSENTNKALDTHIDDSLYTINMCVNNNQAEGSEILFSGTQSNCFNSEYRNKKLFLVCKEDYMIIHLGKHPHQTLELTSGDRTNIILWFK